MSALCHDCGRSFSSRSLQPILRIAAAAVASRMCRSRRSRRSPARSASSRRRIAARFMSEITRLIYDNPEGRRPRRAVSADAAAACRPRQTRRSADPDRAATDAGAGAARRRRVEPTRSSTAASPATSWSMAIIGDRRAAFLCHGLARSTIETLQFFADHPALLTKIYERRRSTFARVLEQPARSRQPRRPPGRARRRRGAVGGGRRRAGDARGAIHPAAVRDERGPGRIRSTTPSASSIRRGAAFALGSVDSGCRRARRSVQGAGRRLHRRVSRMAHPHDAVQSPVVRPGDDPGADQRRSRPARRAAPSSRGFWSRLFAGRTICRTMPRGSCGRSTTSRSTPRGWPRRAARPTCVSARERLDQFAFGQRVFARAPPAAIAPTSSSRCARSPRLADAVADARAHRHPDAVASTRRGASRGAAVGATSAAAFWSLRRSFRARSHSSRAWPGCGTLTAAQVADARRRAVRRCRSTRMAATPARSPRWLRDRRRRGAPAGRRPWRACDRRGMSGPASTDGAPRMSGKGSRTGSISRAAERQRLQQVRDKQDGYAARPRARRRARSARTLGSDGLRSTKCSDADASRAA